MSRVTQDTLHNIADNLTELLVRAGKTKAALARAVRVTEQTIYRWMGGNSFDDKHLEGLAQVFSQWLDYRITPEDLLNRQTYKQLPARVPIGEGPRVDSLAYEGLRELAADMRLCALHNITGYEIEEVMFLNYVASKMFWLDVILTMRKDKAERIEATASDNSPESEVKPPHQSEANSPLRSDSQPLKSGRSRK